MNMDIYQELRRRIVFLEYEPGQVLKEQDLATVFGVSRTPLRTVLSRLEWEHLVKILPRTGILVMELELKTITHVFQARLELESVIGAMAAERMTQEEIGRLERLILSCEGLMTRKNPSRLGQIDFDIKHLFHQAAGNPFLTEISERLYLLTFRLWYYNMLRMSEEEWHMEVLSVKEELVTLKDLLKNATAKEVGKARRESLLQHLKRIQTTFLGLSA